MNLLTECPRTFLWEKNWLYFRNYSNQVSLIRILTVDIPQFWYLAIFLQLLYYMKSILAYFRRYKNCHLNNLGGFEFWFLEKFHTWKCQKLPQFKIQCCSNGQNGNFWGFKMTKIDFLLNLSGRKILKFSTLCISIEAAQVCTLSIIFTKVIQFIQINSQL